VEDVWRRFANGVALYFPYIGLVNTERPDRQRKLAAIFAIFRIELFFLKMNMKLMNEWVENVFRHLRMFDIRVLQLLQCLNSKIV
jgi:hypothetical protein